MSFFRMDVGEFVDSILENYTLISFVHKGPKRKLEKIDIIPTKWIEYEQKKGYSRYTTKFMNDPIEGEDILLMHSLVKNLSDPPEDWPKFTIEIKGKAGM